MTKIWYEVKYVLDLARFSGAIIYEMVQHQHPQHVANQNTFVVSDLNESDAKNQTWKKGTLPGGGYSFYECLFADASKQS